MAALLAALTEAGGVATSAVLVAASSRSALRAAVSKGFLVRLGRGTYALAELGTVDVTASALESRSWARWTEPLTDAELKTLVGRHARAKAGGGALCQLSAASHHGWPILREPTRLQVALPPGRHQPKSLGGCRIHYLGSAMRIDDHAFDAGVTNPLETVLHCAATLPFPEAVAVADSALRSGAVGRSTLLNAADTYAGRGRREVRRVAEVADERAANPFESGLRAILLDTPLVGPTPQYEICDSRFRAVVDLVDVPRRIVVEADSYEFHGGADEFGRDVDRYDDLICRDWLVLRFRLRHVLHDPGRIRDVVQAAVEVRRRQGYPDR